MPAGRCCSKSAISLWDRHPRRLVQKKSQSIVNWPTLCSKRSFWAFNCFNSRLSSWGVSNTLPACYSNASRHLLVRLPIVIPTSRDSTSIKSRRGRLRTRTSLRNLMTLFLKGSDCHFCLKCGIKFTVSSHNLEDFACKGTAFSSFFARLSVFSGGL